MTTAIAAIEPKFAAGEPLTVEDWLDQPDDWPRNELFQGMIVLTPPPDYAHQRVVARIHVAFFHYALEHGGEAGIAPTGVQLASDTAFEPDVFYLSPERLDRVRRRLVRGAPDVVVEVASPSTRRYDVRTKLGAYLEHGVREVWIVDPVAQTVAVHAADATAEPAVVPFGADIPSRALPGIGPAQLAPLPPLPE